MPDKSAIDSAAEQLHILRYEDINGGNRLFGGRLVSWIDEVAAAVGTRYCGNAVTTVSIDNLQFRQPAFLRDLVVIKGHITHVGRTSMEVRVDSYVEDVSGNRRQINRAYLTLVSIDENNKPKPVTTRLILNTEAEKAEWEGAEKRARLNKLRREEGF